MTMTEIVGPVTAPPPGSRALGLRVRPIIRLGMGFRDPDKGFPRKTDYFTVRGDDRAVAKFKQVKGEQPKAVEILLPSQLDQALTIQYRAFKGADGDGSLVAVGHTNFALRDYCGGADLLTVFDPDGTVREVECAGVDANTREPLDELAKDLGLELYTTLRAGMPEVLGFGSFFEISTKGKASTDALWAKTRELYEMFGSRVSFAVKPQLVIRPSSARPVLVKDGVKRRIKTQIFVLDLVVPESIDEMLERLRERQAIIAPQGPEAALYGSPVAPAELAAPEPSSWAIDPDFVDGEEIVEGELVDELPEDAGPPDEDGGGVSSIPPESTLPPSEPETLLDQPAVSDSALLRKARATRPPKGSHAEMTLAQILRLEPLEGARALYPLLGEFPESEPMFGRLLWALVRVERPELASEVEGK